jgi:predicted outer membrane repeat protein
MANLTRRSARAGAALIAVGLLPVLALAATIHVPADQATIASGIAAAADGDTVLVACGTYFEHDIAYQSGVVVRSESGSAECVTVDAQQLGRTFNCYGQAEVSLAGLTLTGGQHAGGGGAVLACCGQTVTFTDCVFSNSTSTFYGGGVYFDSELPGSRLIVSGCRFVGDAADGWDGAALNVHGHQGVSVTISDCMFEGNAAGYWGGAIEFNACDATVTGTVFENNAAGNLGGVLFCTQSDVTLDGCTFAANEAGDYGGAIYMNGGTISAAGCTFSANHASNGGCLYLNNASLTMERTILAFSGDGSAVRGSSAEADVLCCDVFGNIGGDFVGLLAGLDGVEGNFSADPLFCDVGAGDYHLAGNSPCVDGNHPDGAPCGQIGALGVGCSVVPVADLPAASLALFPPYPNPFNPRTTVSFTLPATGQVQVAIYDARGMEVVHLVDEALAAGTHLVDWDGRDACGASMPSGTYFCRLTTSSGVETRKLQLIR